LNTASIKLIRIAALVGIIIVLALVSAVGSQYVKMVFMLMFLYMALGQFWNLLGGYSGLVSLGQQIFIGLGGYTLAVTTVYYGFPLWLGALTSGVLCLVFALLISRSIFRMSGVYFSIGTWVVAECLLIWFSNWRYTKMGMGMFIKPARSLDITETYYIAMVVAIATVALVYGLMRSKIGLALMAMRDNPGATEVCGVPVFRCKLYCFLISSFGTGVVASVLYMNMKYIVPDQAFGINWTVALVFIAIIGGIGTIEGPILGAVVYVLLQQWLSDYGSVSMLILGVIAIVVMLAVPKGILGTLQEKLGFEFLSPRRFL
jgi:branched-chain amino acid transport system permease protein